VTYAEFGPASHGVGDFGGAVAPGSVNIDTNLPKVEFDSSHHPTEQSMEGVKEAIAKNDQGGIDPSTVRINYFQTSEADTMQLKNWMKQQQQSPGKYRVIAVRGRQNCLKRPKANSGNYSSGASWSFFSRTELSKSKARR
jgi:hypothetical protein